MDAKQALELKQARERALVEIASRLPEGRKSGELSALVSVASKTDGLLTRYEAMKDTPAIAEVLSTAFAAVVDRIDTLTALPPANE